MVGSAVGEAEVRDSEEGGRGALLSLFVLAVADIRQTQCFDAIDSDDDAERDFAN